MRLMVTKCHGSGNDFPLVDARGLDVPPDAWPAIARALADPSGAVGGDGLLLLHEGRDGCAFGFAMYNRDGSEAETCLNGLRCVARAGFAALGIDAAEVSLATSTATVSRVPDLAPHVYTVLETAGPVDLDIARWPMHLDRTRNVEQPIAELDSDLPFTAVAIPNPHLIAFVDTVDEEELVRIGLLCEAAPPWLPNRANVSMAEVRGDATLFVRTHERGVGLTNACGSAMAAATHAAALTERIAWEAEITVLNRGGMVRATAHRDGRVSIAGNATFEWNGTVEVGPDGATDLIPGAIFAREINAWAEVKARAAAAAAAA